MLFYYQNEDQNLRYAELGTRRWIHLNKHVFTRIFWVYGLVWLAVATTYYFAPNDFISVAYAALTLPVGVSAVMMWVAAIRTPDTQYYVFHKTFFMLVGFPFRRLIVRDLSWPESRYSV